MENTIVSITGSDGVIITPLEDIRFIVIDKLRGNGFFLQSQDLL